MKRSEAIKKLSERFYGILDPDLYGDSIDICVEIIDFIENKIGMIPPARQDLSPFDNEACPLIGRGYVWEPENSIDTPKEHE